MLFGALCITGPLVYYIKFAGYSFTRPEIIGLFCLCMLLGGFAGYLLSRLQWTGRVILIAVLASMGLSFLPGMQTDWVYMLGVVSIIAISMFATEQAVKIFTTMALVFVASTVVFPVGEQLLGAEQIINAQAKRDQQLPPVIHIVLDEHIGINGLPKTVANTAEFQQQLTDFYTRHGFTLYSNGFSHYARTYNSLPNAFNFTVSEHDNQYFPGQRQERELKDNHYLAAFSKQGYAINVYQSDYLGYCKAKGVNYRSCYTYPVHNLKYLQDLPINTQEKFRFLLKSYTLSSVLYQKFLTGYQKNLRPLLHKVGITLPNDPWYQAQISTIGTLDALQKMQADIIAAPEGNVFFAHLLIPHSAYIFDENCQVIPKTADWWVNYSDDAVAVSEAGYQQRYQRYEAQIGCVYKQLDQFIAQLQQHGIYDKAAIMIHGDHGSRIVHMPPYPDNRELLQQQDFRDAYSTVIAIKFPGQAGGVEPEPVVVNRVVAAFSQQLTGQPKQLPGNDQFVYLTTQQMKSGVDLTPYPVKDFGH